VKIFIAVTCYDGKVFGKCADSILKNCVSLMKAGHIVTVHYHNELYIDRARNFCVNLFLESDCSDMVFVDSDLQFDTDAILKLIEYDRDLVAGAYRLKQQLIQYPIVLDFSHENNCKEESTGLVYAKALTTGLMRIQRKVFEELIKHYGMKCDDSGLYQFFRTGTVFPDTNSWYGEDSYFCRIWRDMGREMFICPDINITHIGGIEYKGNYHEYLLGLRLDRWADNLDKQKEGIDGWCSDEELRFLRKMAFESDSIVEIGSWKGRSTKELLKACNGNVYAVDNWLGSKEWATEVGVFIQDVYNEFMKNVGHFPNLVVLKGDSLEMVKTFNGDKVDMVYIDAGHTYEECKADIEAWLPKCNKFICGHDYVYPDVKKAVDEKFKDIELIDSIWFVRL
jgi:hypothetical protein